MSQWTSNRTGIPVLSRARLAVVTAPTTTKKTDRNVQDSIFYDAAVKKRRERPKTEVKWSYLIQDRAMVGHVLLLILCDFCYLLSHTVRSMAPEQDIPQNLI